MIVKRCHIDIKGIPVGVLNNNPLLDSIKYGIEFSDGDIEVLAANLAVKILTSICWRIRQYTIDAWKY